MKQNSFDYSTEKQQSNNLLLKTLSLIIVTDYHQLYPAQNIMNLVDHHWVITFLFQPKLIGVPDNSNGTLSFEVVRSSEDEGRSRDKTGVNSPKFSLQTCIHTIYKELLFRWNISILF